MATARDTLGSVFKQGTATLMARVIDAAGDPINPTDVATCHYSVLEVNEAEPDESAVIAGHDNVALGVGDVLFASLQTDDRWTLDAQGYNFRHEIDISSSNAFPKAGVRYYVRYRLAPSVGQPVIFRFALRAI